MTRTELIAIMRDPDTIPSQVYAMAADDLGAEGDYWAEKLRTLPEYMHGGIVRYILLGIKPSDFLSAVFSNDLMGAMKRADDNNIGLIKEYAMFLYNGAPNGCYGSAERFKEWDGLFPAEEEASA